MKVCYLTNTLDVNSGWGRYSFEVISRFKQKKDFEIKVLTEEKSQIVDAENILENSFRGLFYIFLNSFRVRRYIKECDLIHCLDGYPYGVIGALSSLGLKKKLIISGIGTYSVMPFCHPIKKIFLAWAYRRAYCITCISTYTMRRIRKKVNLKKINVVHMGIDFDRFSKQQKQKNKKDNKIVLSVGALKRRKGYHISIPALALVKNNLKNIKYYIIGSQSNQSYYNYLKELVAKYNLQDNVFFIAEINDKKLIELYQDCNLFVLTSVNVGFHFEGYGLVYLEAGACGKPVIGTFNCGAEDAVDNQITGLLVEQNNIEQTAEAMLKILQNNDLALRLGEAGRKKAKAMSWQKTVDQYEQIYRTK